MITKVFLGYLALLLAFNGTEQAYYAVMPLRWWVHYQKLEVIEQTEPEPELVRVWRTIPAKNGILALTRYVELHEELPDGTTMQHCQSAMQTTAEAVTNPHVTLTLAEFVGERCDLQKHENKRLRLQACYRLDFPHGRHKQKCFYEGPFRVSSGALRIGSSPLAPFSHLRGGLMQASAYR